MTEPLLVGRIANLEIPRAVLEASWRHVARRGSGRHEAIVIWAGRVAHAGARVVTAVAPPPEDVQASARLHRLNTRAHASMSRWMERHGLLALAQVHTHPDSWVGHSETDDAYPFAPDDGFLSIVWPRYALGAVAPMSEWGVHERRDDTWYQLLPSEVLRRLFVVSDPATVTDMPLVEVA